MQLMDELNAKIISFATEDWGDIPNGHTPPTPEELTFGNTGKRIDACVLYADLHRSTEMVDTLSDTLAASYYKAFLHCCARIIKSNDGTIQAYDGDRVMSIYVGEGKETNAVISALKIFHAVKKIDQYFKILAPTDWGLKHTVGIDTGTVLAAKTGVRVDSDLVWVGPAANYAAKLNSFTGLDNAFPTRITKAVYDRLPGHLLQHNRSDIWSGPYDNVGKHHYRSNFEFIIA
ncbi:hypothetical protein ASF73_16130 [Xanthomonas sp. Leaf131]|uniref:adenylate/guanylate cyclase domain-containing protein n=1 Tax=Xanthomonas arboricola TaxID=56448 RepID=UPI0006F5BD5B|nr:adenylate/guanylate cyclase domain-containing protein [Xanthomonas arboricola]KQQ84097.1 hypothetical protein ASF73_16130 [Xanthomonas sp. Leaf131]